MSRVMTPYEMAAFAANLADDKKSRDIVVLNMEEVSSLADYFVVLSVDSKSQMIAIADYLSKAFKRMDLQPLGEQLDKAGRWTLLDFGDVVIHIFNPEARTFYHLERFWSHATEIPSHLWLKENRQAS